MGTALKPFIEHCLENLRSEIEDWSDVHNTPAEYAVILDSSSAFSNTLLLVICDGEGDFDMITFKGIPEANAEGAIKTVKWNGVEHLIIGSVKDGMPELTIQDNPKWMRTFFDEGGRLREDAKFANRVRDRLVRERKERKKEKKEKQKEEKRQQAAESKTKTEKASKDLKACREEETTRDADQAMAQAVAHLHELSMQGVDISGARILDTSTVEGAREIEEASSQGYRVLLLEDRSERDVAGE